MGALRLILGDQLSPSIATLQGLNPEQDTVMLCEVMEEATYVEHHPKKIAFLFSAMRHFAGELEAQGACVRYAKLDDPDNAGSFTGELKRAVAELKPDRLEVTEPGEYRVLAMMRSWKPCSPFRSSSTVIRAFWPIMMISRPGRRARHSCVWSFSIARCGGNIKSLWSLMASRRAVPGTMTARTANRQTRT
jgi:hypothetical protein